MVQNKGSSPVYIFYIVGYPSALVDFYPQAAKELGINIKIEYHGCCVNTLFKDETLGVTITDASFEQMKFEEENEIANQYYTKEIGDDWLERLLNRSKELIEKYIDDHKDEDFLPF